MPGVIIKVGQVWFNSAAYGVPKELTEYHIVTSIYEHRSPWGNERNVYATIFRRGQIIRENSLFTRVDENNLCQDNLYQWTCITKNGMEGLQRILRRANRKSQKPKVYRRSLRKQYRERLIAEALIKPIA